MLLNSQDIINVNGHILQISAIIITVKLRNTVNINQNHCHCMFWYNDGIRNRLSRDHELTKI